MLFGRVGGTREGKGSQFGFLTLPGQACLSFSLFLSLSLSLSLSLVFALSPSLLSFVLLRQSRLVLLLATKPYSADRCHSLLGMALVLCGVGGLRHELLTCQGRNTKLGAWYSSGILVARSGRVGCTVSSSSEVPMDGWSRMDDHGDGQVARQVFFFCFVFFV